jgi:hypothetical protein|tara:strand:- start:293 stop:688 length:396 start_codon:yes stop_codon:yes gene_type:complete
LADIFKSKSLVLANTSVTTLYTVPTTDDTTVPSTPSTTALIKSIRLYNAHTGNVLVTLTLTDKDSATGANTVSTLFKMYLPATDLTTDSFPIGNPFEVLSQPLVANEGDIIKITAGTAAKIHVQLSVLEIT